MDSVYTLTIVTAAQKRGILIEVLDRQLPVFELSFNGKKIRCYNGLTDRVGAATFHLANDKGAANRYLFKLGYPVPPQEVYTTMTAAAEFLDLHKSIVVKPVSQWGGRGVSTHVSTTSELRSAITFAHRFGDELVLEACVKGIDWRLIYVNNEYVCAIQREAAFITGDGVSSIRKLLRKKNLSTGKIDPSNIIPIDKETLRCIECEGLTYCSVPPEGARVFVRRTTNYHTGGTVEIVTDKIPADLIASGKEISAKLGVFVLGIDVLYDTQNKTYFIIELSPDMAISPPEGDMVAEAFLDSLFPDSKNTYSAVS